MDATPPPDAKDAPPLGKRPRESTPEKDVASPPADGLSLSCVVLIEVITTSPDFLYPWRMRSQERCAGSGFVISGERILTNFHVVEDAIDVRLRKHGMSRRWRGKVVAIGPDVDLALLEVHEEEAGKGDSFWANVTPASWHPSLPSLQARPIPSHS
jgi:S1-C subfamily serine protease